MGVFLKRTFKRETDRFFSALRQYTELFDKIYVGKDEQEVKRNSATFREYVKKIIVERKEQMKNSEFN